MKSLGVGNTTGDLPNAVELEKAVIGAMLLEYEAVIAVVEILSPEHFYDRLYAGVYSVLLKMYDRGEEIDLYTATQECKKHSELAKTKIPIAALLADTTSTVGSGAHVVRHALIVKDRFIARKIIKTGLKTMQLGRDSSRSIDEAIDYLSEQSDSINELLVEGESSKDIGDVVGRSLQQAEQRVIAHQEGRATGITTGIKKLDELTGGWQGGQMVVVAGRPSMGKTALALHLIKAAARQGVASLFVSLEMSDVSLVDRLLLSESKVSPNDFKSGNIAQAEILDLEIAGGVLNKLPITIDATARTMRQIRARAQLLKKRGKCDILVIDYLQIVSMTERSVREQEVAQSSREIKALAMELQIPVIVLSQLSRKVEERGSKEPMLADLRESGAIEQDADNVLFLYRPAYYQFEEYNAGALGNVNTKGLGVINVAKQRNGACGYVLFSHNDSMTKLTDWNRYESRQPLAELNENPF